MTTKGQRKKLAKLQEQGKVVYKKVTPPKVVLTKAIPVAKNSEVSRSPYFVGKAFKPKDKVDMGFWPNQNEGGTDEELSEN